MYGSSNVSPSLVAEPSAIADIDDTISAAIVVTANVADFRLSANMAQVMGQAKYVCSLGAFIVNGVNLLSFSR